MPKRKKENYNYNKKKTTHLAFESKHNKSDKQKEKKNNKRSMENKRAKSWKCFSNDIKGHNGGIDAIRNTLNFLFNSQNSKIKPVMEI